MSDYLDRLEAQLVELTERGAHQRLRARRPGFARRGFGLRGVGGPAGGPRPPRRPSEALALLAAAGVVIAVVAIVLVNVHSGGKPQRSSAAAGHPTTPIVTAQPGHATTAPYTVPQPVPVTPYVPEHVTPQSFTAISELNWWVLGPGSSCPATAGKEPCGAILHTTDGGRHFVPVPAPDAPLSSPAGGKGYSQLRFADANNGFAYGPDLYVTHDGGATWNPVDLGGQVADLAISAGEAYAIVRSGTAASGRLMHSPVGQNQWTTLSAAGEVSGGLWVLGQEVIVQSGSDGPGTDLLVSQDGGGGFSRQPVPSPGLPCDFQAQSPQTIWAHCVTGTESGIWWSSDYITGFKRVRGAGLAPQPNSAVFAAASDTTAVVGYQQLYRTADSGATWSQVQTAGVAQWAYLGFTDATHGVALGYLGSVAPANERLFYTTDGGQSYHLVALP